MSYTIRIAKSIQKQLNELPSDVKQRVVGKIQNLVNEPRPDGVVKLKGSEHQ